MSIFLKKVFIVAMFGASVLAQASETAATQQDGNMFIGATERSDSQQFEGSTADHPICFYNSRLAAIIVKAYWDQKNQVASNCGGLSKEQLESLDFNAIQFPSDYISGLRERIRQSYEIFENIGQDKPFLDAQNEVLDYAQVAAMHLHFVEPR